MQREESREDQEREVLQGLARLGIDARDAIVIDDQSRLSRADNACAFVTDLVYSGGRFVSTGEGIDTAQDGWELRVKIMEVHSGATIRDLGRRVHRGQKGRVQDDGAAGDHPYGYESFYLD